jgi:NAD-dependent DNA ligase
MDYRKYMGKAETEKALLTLRGLLQGITIDEKVNRAEIEELRNWLHIHKTYKHQSPFKELIPVIIEVLSDNVLEQEEIENILWVCDQFNDGKYYGFITLSLQLLHGIFHGILADKKLSDTEIKRLNDWLDSNEDVLIGTYPYDEIRSLITTVLQDGVITEDERGMLIAFMSDFIDCAESYNISQREIDALKEQYQISGICSMQPNITFKDKIFSFTGKSSRASRTEIAEAVTDAGGTFKDSVVKNTDFLIVGDEGNPCWAFSCYGRKVEKAVNLRKSGSKIQIVHENDFWDCIE